MLYQFRIGWQYNQGLWLFRSWKSDYTFVKKKDGERKAEETRKQQKCVEQDRKNRVRELMYHQESARSARSLCQYIYIYQSDRSVMDVIYAGGVHYVSICMRRREEEEAKIGNFLHRASLTSLYWPRLVRFPLYRWLENGQLLCHVPSPILSSSLFKPCHRIH